MRRRRGGEEEERRGEEEEVRRRRGEERHRVDVGVGPEALLLLHQPVLEQPQRLVGPQTHQALHLGRRGRGEEKRVRRRRRGGKEEAPPRGTRESLQGPDRLADAPHPPGRRRGERRERRRRRGKRRREEERGYWGEVRR